MHSVALLLAAQNVITSDLAPAWEVAKGVLLTVAAAGALGVFKMRDDVREMKQELFGRDGTNGMRSVVRKNAERLDAIDKRHVDEDAVERERERYEGDDRRHHLRRHEDILREQQS